MVIQVKNMLKHHWDYVAGFFGFVATVTVKQYTEIAAAVIATLTILLLTPRVIFWWLKLVRHFKQKNNPMEDKEI